ncbi:MAG: hypothetical protein ACHQRM_12135 [Bacteroidia bacterium]
MKTSKQIIYGVLLTATLSSCGIYNQFKVGSGFREDKEKINLPKMNLSMDVSALVNNDIGTGLSSKLVKAVMPNTTYHTLYSYGNELSFFHTSSDFANSSYGSNKMNSVVSIPWEYYTDAYFTSKKKAYRTPAYVTTQHTSGNYTYTSGKYKALKNAWFSYMVVNDAAIPAGNISHSAVLGYDLKMNQNLVPLVGDNAPASVGFIYPMDPRVSDMADIFAWEMKKNIMNSTGTSDDAKGTAMLSIKSVNQKKIIPLMIYLGMADIFTMETGSVIGYPWGHQRAKVRLQMDIKDKNGKIVKTYTAKGHRFMLNSLYYGLTSTGSRRKTHAIAMHRALRSIKAQMKKDAPAITAALNQ